MKVKANCYVNLNGAWHSEGDVFEISDADAAILGEALTVISRDALQDDFDLHAPLSESADEMPKRRGRPKKTNGEIAE